MFNLCSECNGNGGMIVGADLQIDFEICLVCGGHGRIYGGDDDGKSKMSELRPTTKRRPGD